MRIFILVFGLLLALAVGVLGRSGYSMFGSAGGIKKAPGERSTGTNRAGRTTSPIYHK